MNNAIFDHTLNFYKALEAAAKEETLEDDTKVSVFRGQVTKAYRSLGVSQAYYSQVRRILIELGCISIIQQGARNTDSVIVLHHPPDDAEFTLSQDRLTPRLSNATLVQTVQGLQRQIGGLNVVEALADHEKRLLKVEREVKKIGAKPQGTRR